MARTIPYYPPAPQRSSPAGTAALYSPAGAVRWSTGIPAAAANPGRGRQISIHPLSRDRLLPRCAHPRNETFFLGITVARTKHRRFSISYGDGSKIRISTPLSDMIDPTKTSTNDVMEASPCIPAHLIKSTSTQSQLVVSEPLKIQLDSPTDYLAILIVPLALAIAAGVFAMLTNRQQIKANTANYRHTWQLDLRNAIVSFLSAATQIKVRAMEDPLFVTKVEAEALRTQLLSAQWTVTLMLDTKKPYATELKDAMSELMDTVFSDTPMDGDANAKIMKRLSKAARFALEQAWQDIRRDLQHRQPRDEGGSPNV